MTDTAYTPTEEEKQRTKERLSAIMDALEMALNGKAIPITERFTRARYKVEQAANNLAWQACGEKDCTACELADSQAHILRWIASAMELSHKEGADAYVTILKNVSRCVGEFIGCLPAHDVRVSVAGEVLDAMRAGLKEGLGK